MENIRREGTGRKRKRDLGVRVATEPETELDQLTESQNRDQVALGRLDVDGSMDGAIMPDGTWQPLSEDGKELRAMMDSASAKRAKHWGGSWVEEAAAAMLAEEAEQADPVPEEEGAAAAAASSV